jgi:hypothetical protein
MTGHGNFDQNSPQDTPESKVRAMNIQYVTDDKGNRVAVQIPLEQWEIIKAEMESYGAESEMGADLLGRPGTGVIPYYFWQ